jgi:hypothetical protein
MYTNTYQKEFRAIRQWFKITRFPTKPVPVSVRCQYLVHCVRSAGLSCSLGPSGALRCARQASLTDPDSIKIYIDEA